MVFLKDPKDTPPITKIESRDERKERFRRERAENVAYQLEKQIALWDPNTVHNATVDPFKTLFVSRINYDTSESKLKREFESYGPIKKVSFFILIRNDSNCSLSIFKTKFGLFEREFFADYTDSQNENFFFLYEQISNFLKGYILLVTNRPKKISLACSFCRRGGNMFFVIRRSYSKKGGKLLGLN